MKKILIVFYFVIISISYSFHIVPTAFERNIDKGDGYQEFNFPNNSLETMRYKFSVSSGSKGRGDMSPWVEVFPEVLTIKPGETGVLKVYARSPEGTPIGEYGFHLDSTPVSIPKVGKDGKTIEANIGVKLAVSLEMIGYVGDLKPQLKILKHRIFEDNGKTKLEVTVKNNSPKRGVEYGFEVKGKNNSSVRKLVGRIYENQTVTTTFDLEGMKKGQPYELTIFEDISNAELEKIKL